MFKRFIMSFSLALIIILLILGGCSGVDSSNNFHKLLKLIPSGANYTEYSMILIDHANYLADKNISVTKSNGEPMTIREFYEVINDDPVGKYSQYGFDITGYGRYAIEAGIINNKHVGYDFTCVDAELEAFAPPSNVVAAVGRFDPQATKDALSHQDDWLPSIKNAYNVEEYRGITVHSWGSGLKIDLTAVLTPPHLDQIGRAKPLAVTGDYLFYAPTMDLMKLMIDASQDKTESLADLPEFASLADSLFEMNAYAAIMGNEQIASGNPDYEGTYPGPVLKKFITFASGVGEDEKGSCMVLVIYHENSKNAEANVSLLEQRIANTSLPSTGQIVKNLFTDIDISVEGRVLKAKFYTTHIGGWAGWFYETAPLLLHEK